jgi:voltage-gated potassium channel
MARMNVVERRFQAFLRTPLSVRNAMGVIVSATLVSVFAGGFLITLVDGEDFPDFGTGLWWALQTVTTVGYGDVTPKNTVGRFVGAVFMLEAIAFVAIVTAAITSSFVERARRERAPGSDAASSEQLTAQLSKISARLERIEQALERDGSPGARDG